MTIGNNVTHNTKHTILFNKTKFTPYCVPLAHAPASVIVDETTNAEKQLSQARNESSVAMMVIIQTIFWQYFSMASLNSPKKRKVAQNPLMPKDTCIARIEVQHQPAVYM